jgi:hypothetical protein
MDTPAFASLMTQERTRIHDAIKAARAKPHETDREIAQLAAITAYDAALKGKGIATEQRKPRGRRGEKREAIRDLISQHPDGLTRSELLTAMEAHGNKAAEQSISNALSALKKTGRVTQEGRRYYAGRTDPSLVEKSAP